jgi:hypothetical protein
VDYVREDLQYSGVFIHMVETFQDRAAWRAAIDVCCNAPDLRIGRRVMKIEWTALVVSLENITENVYLGNQRSMTITNCLFRLGGAAALLSNRRRHWWSARCLPLPDVMTK